MKYPLIALLALLLPAASFACGRGIQEPDELSDPQNIASSLNGKKLQCELFTSSGEVVNASDGVLKIYAIYRCPGSPVRGKLEAFAQKLHVNEVRRENDLLRFDVRGLEGNLSVRCQ